MNSQLEPLVIRLETAVNRLELLQGAPVIQQVPPAPAAQVQQVGSTVPFVVEYDDLLAGPLRTFLSCCSKIGGDVATIGKLVEDAFQTQRTFLIAASLSQKPSANDLPKVLEPTGKKIQEVIGFRESHRTSAFFNHLSAISESIPGLSWVAVEPAPGPFVKEMGDAAMFYSNRVLKDYREKDKLHVDWVQNWNSVFKELQAYIKLHHTTGVAWNAKGESALDNLSNAGGSCVPPPPPGVPPPPPPMAVLEPKAVVDDGRSALFSQINQGEGITSSLKRVSDDLKSHKNPSIREGPRPFVKAPEGTTKVNGTTPVKVEKPPRMALQGKKWFVEYQKNNANLILDEVKMDHSIYIYRCENTVVQVKGKANSVILDSCKKSSVVFDSLVSACEIVNCQSCQMQVMDTVPTVSIEKTDGCQVYLSPASLKVEIITAKSSEMNIMIPKSDGDFAECPVPEQFKTTIQGTKLHTAITEKAG